MHVWQFYLMCNLYLDLMLTGKFIIVNTLLLYNILIIIVIIYNIVIILNEISKTLSTHFVWMGKSDN